MTSGRNFACIAALLFGNLLLAEQAPVRVAIVVGGHAFHPSFFRLFEDEHLQCEVQPHPSSFNLRNTDVLILYDMLEDLEPAKRDRLRAFLESGKGLVVLHHALIDYGSWEWWEKEVVGVRYRRKKVDAIDSKFRHDIKMHVRPTSKHPVLKGIGPFELFDEGYRDQAIGSNIQVLLETEHADSDKPLAWIGPYRRSRVIAIQPGHGPEAFHNETYVRLVRNAIQWAAGRLTD